MFIHLPGYLWGAVIGRCCCEVVSVHLLFWSVVAPIFQLNIDVSVQDSNSGCLSQWINYNCVCFLKSESATEYLTMFDGFWQRMHCSCVRISRPSICWSEEKNRSPPSACSCREAHHDRRRQVNGLRITQISLMDDCFSQFIMNSSL